jgi:hypothetical protein
MGIFSFLGNLGAGIQGSRLGKKQMQMGQQMMSEAQDLSASYARPEMQTPAAIQAMMELSSGRRFQNMPGMTNLQNQINQATAGGVKAMERMGTGAEAFGGVAQMYANQMNQQSQNAVTNAQFRDTAEQQYMGALEGLGGWQQQAWQWNQADPYLQAQQKAAMLETMGRQGQWEGLKTKMGSWAESFQGMGGALDQTVNQITSAFPGLGTFGQVAGALTA